jgi:hypothetical protein
VTAHVLAQRALTEWVSSVRTASAGTMESTVQSVGRAVMGSAKMASPDVGFVHVMRVGCPMTPVAAVCVPTTTMDQAAPSACARIMPRAPIPCSVTGPACATSDGQVRCVAHASLATTVRDVTGARTVESLVFAKTEFRDQASALVTPAVPATPAACVLRGTGASSARDATAVPTLTVWIALPVTGRAYARMALTGRPTV